MKPTSSPWGKIQSSEKFSSGANIYLVDCAGHGGLMIPTDTANNLKISQYGEDFQTKSGSWKCFEEDCQISVAVLALTLSQQYPLNLEKMKNTLSSIKSWNNSYLEEINLDDHGSVGLEIKELIESDLKEKFSEIDKVRKFREQSEHMRNEKSPDLIVSASRIDKYDDLIPYLKTLPHGIMDMDDLGRNREILRSLQKEVDFFNKDEDALFHKPKVVLVWTASGNKHLVRDYESSRELNLLSSCDKIGSFQE